MAWHNIIINLCNPKKPCHYKRIPLNSDKLKQLYHQGKFIRDIASYFNCSIPTIKRHLKFLIPDDLRRYRFNYSQLNPVNKRIIKLYTNNHYSTKKIADITGLSDETVRRRLQRTGTRLRERNFKSMETFHPEQLNRKKNKKYPIIDLELFNRKFLEYYCLLYPEKRVAELLQIDRATVSRRIMYLESRYQFKMRFCKRCRNLFRFRVTGHQMSSNTCSRCRENVSQH